MYVTALLKRAVNEGLSSYSMYLSIERTGARALSRDLKHAITGKRIYFQLVYDYPSACSHPFPVSFSLTGYTLVRLTEIDFCVTIHSVIRPFHDRKIAGIEKLTVNKRRF